MLATTTSVDATGLLDVLADAFAGDTGITLRWIAVGTGAALKQARDGNADVVIVHAKKLEDEFVRAGFGVNRRVFARNYFIVVGPADDPARVAGASSAADAFGRIRVGRPAPSSAAATTPAPTPASSTSGPAPAERPRPPISRRARAWPRPCAWPPSAAPTR